MKNSHRTWEDWVQNSHWHNERKYPYYKHTIRSLLVSRLDKQSLHGSWINPKWTIEYNMKVTNAHAAQIIIKVSRLPLLSAKAPVIWSHHTHEGTSKGALHKGVATSAMKGRTARTMPKTSKTAYWTIDLVACSFIAPACEEVNPMDRKKTEENRDSHDARTANQLTNNIDALEKRGNRSIALSNASAHHNHN